MQDKQVEQKEKKTHKYIIVHFSCQKVGEFNKKPHFDIYNLKKVTYSHQSGSYVFKNDAASRERSGSNFWQYLGLNYGEGFSYFAVNFFKTLMKFEQIFYSRY